jgi:uncharacterized protein YjlB
MAKKQPTTVSMSLYELVGQMVQCVGADSRQTEFKTGRLTCINAGTDEYRVTAATDKGAEGAYFAARDVARVVGTVLHFKPFI